MERKGLVVVTGATSGIGLEVAKSLAVLGFDVVLGCRNMNKGRNVVGEIKKLYPISNIYLYQLDLSSFVSVEQFASEVISTHGEIYALINNAGSMFKNYTIVPDGHEATMMVNYLSTQLLTERLLPRIEIGGHVVFTGSCTYRLGRVGRELRTETYRRMQAYYNSKLAITTYAKHLSQICSDRVVTVIDPGVVDTGIIKMDCWYDPIANLFFRPFIRSPRKAAELHIGLLTSNGQSTHGCILSKRGVRDINLPSGASIGAFAK